MKFLQKRQNEKSFTKSDYVVLSYEQLLQVNGAGGSSSGGGGPSGPSSTGHYNRNDNNTDLPSSPAEAEKQGYHKMDENKDVYHEQGTSTNCDPSKNNKYISEDGSKEVVYNDKGEIVTDAVNLGTYNYANPESAPVEHFLKDVVPYWILGNTPNDPSTFDERILGTYSGDVNLTRDERFTVMDTYYEHH